MKNGRIELKPGEFFTSSGKVYQFEKVENGSAIVRDSKGRKFIYGLELFRRILMQIGYEMEVEG